MRRVLAIVFALAWLAAPSIAFPQTRPAATSSNNAVFPAFRAFGSAGMTVFTANDSFRAVFDSAAGPLFGGGVEASLSPHVFVSLAVLRFAQTGRRSFVFDNQVFDLGTRTRVVITPIEISGGYRFVLRPRVRPYISGGISWHRYSESSPGSSVADDAVHQTFTGYQATAGIESPVRRWLSVAGEAQLTTVPNALGQNQSSVGNAYDEHNLGGVRIQAKIIVGR